MCLLFALALLAGALAGCSKEEVGGSSSAPSSAAPVSSSSLAAPASASSVVPTFGGIPVSKNTAGMLSGIWFHEVAGSDEGLVYQFKFEEQPGQMTISGGMMHSDAGGFFSGAYRWEEDGLFTAEVAQSVYGEEKTMPTQNISFAAEWTNGEYRQLRITLLAATNATSAFRQTFQDIFDEPLVYEELSNNG